MNKVFCWDFDGTLAYARRLWSKGVYDALHEVCPDTPLSIEDVFGRIMVEMPWRSPEADHTAHSGENWWPYMNGRFLRCYADFGVDEESAMRACPRIRDMIMRHGQYALYPGAAETLRAVHAAGGRNVLLSNNYPELRLVTDELGLNGLLDEYVVSALVGCEKPRPEIFEYARSLGGAGEYFMVGDNVDADIAGGNAAGMTTILVHQGRNAAADYCFDELTDIKALI